MPLIAQSDYTPKSYRFFNGHQQTLRPGMFRRVQGVRYTRERLELSDGDFIDLDWIYNRQKQLVILTHGLEGNAYRQYMMGAARFFSERDWDVLAWNCRSCSGVMNRHLRLYHHGEIGDIHQVVQHSLARHDYEQIVLLGYSMGGSISLKYASVYADTLAPQISHVVAFSSPLDLQESIKAIEKRRNVLYRSLFRQRLEYKIRLKAQQFPRQLDVARFKDIRSWRDFDTFFSAPMNGFDSVEAFYYEASAKNFIPRIRIPALLVNAYNDPIIPSTCSPIELAKQHDFFYLEMPHEGGHVGFTLPEDPLYSWMEYRAWDFVHKNTPDI